MKDLLTALWNYRRLGKKVSFAQWMKLYVADKWAPARRIWSVQLKNLPFPCYFRTRTVDIGLIRSILVNSGAGEYPAFCDYAPTFIVDAGANIGIATLFFKSHYPDATVVAIEPNEQNCELFEQNTRGYSDVHLIRAGLGPDKGRFFKIRDESVAPYSYQLAQAEQGIREITIPEICEQFGRPRIDIMKCDIEGGEKALLERNVEWIAGVDNLFVELHDHYALGASKNLLALVKGEFFLRFKGENVILTRKYLKFR